MLPWALRKGGPPAPGFGRLLGTVLSARGVSEPEKLLNPRECGLPPNAEKAAALIKSACRVLVTGDYDCDGLTGAAILLRALRMVGVPAVVYIPRREDGYGFHVKAVNIAASSGCDVIVAVDCGVSDQETINYAASKGLKVVVADHHHFDTAPKNCILVHPRDHKNPHLAGAAVAYKIVRAMGLPEYPFVQLAAIATLADAVCLSEGNRALVRKGLSQPLLPGVKALLDTAGAELTPDAVCYQVAPRINAASRMGNPLTALRLLMADDSQVAAEAAEKLDALNGRRKVVVEQTLQSCGNYPVVMLDCPAGVLGIVAGRLSERLGLPGVVVNTDGKGSARAPEGYSLVDIFKNCPSVTRFGGHSCAVGFEIKPQDFSVFREEFLQSLEFRPAFLKIDAALGFVPDPEEVIELEKIGPFGPGNPEPLFLVRGVASVKAYERCARVRVGPLDGVLFNGDAARYDGKKIAAVGSFRVSGYTGRAEMIIRDLRPDVHVNRAFLAQAWKLREKLPDTPEYRVARAIFRELNLESAREKRNLFESRAYRRYALEVVR